MADDIESLIKTLSALSKPPSRILMNEKWLLEQLDKGLVRKQDYLPNGINLFTGITVEITEDVDTYRLVYNKMI